MIKSITFSLAAGLFFLCSSLKINTVENQLLKTEKDSGWEILFDGKTTNGWHNYGKQNVGNEWKVENGVLHLDASAKDKEGGEATARDQARGHFAATSSFPRGF